MTWFWLQWFHILVYIFGWKVTKHLHQFWRGHVFFFLHGSLLYYSQKKMTSSCYEWMYMHVDDMCVFSSKIDIAKNEYGFKVSSYMTDNRVIYSSLSTWSNIYKLSLDFTCAPCTYCILLWPTIGWSYNDILGWHNYFFWPTPSSCPQ